MSSHIQSLDRKKILKIVISNNILLSTKLSTIDIYNLLLALGIIDTISHDKSYGILGIDIPFIPAQWVEKITGTDWNIKYNPILLENKTWVYHVQLIKVSVLSNAIAMIRNIKKSNKYPWKSLYPYVIELFDKNNISEQFEEIINTNKYTVALIGWKGHMRFMFKQPVDNTISFFDPWMQTLNNEPFFHNIQNNLESIFGYKTKFVKRVSDQSEENSCVIDSLARAIMIAEHGEAAAKWKWDSNTYDYALLAARLIHINM